jgi:hypothetical protein
MSASEWTLNALISNGSQSTHHIVKYFARYGLSAWHQEAKRRSPLSLRAWHKNEVPGTNQNPSTHLN